MIIRKLITFFAVLMLLASTATAQTVYTGTISETVTLSDGASITLNNATITGGIVCEGTAEITLVGENDVKVTSLASNLIYQTPGIKIGGTNTTLTIKGDGSLTATGGSASAGIGLGRTWDANATGGSIVIESGNITASGDIGIGIGTVGNSKTASLDGIIIKGGTINASLGSGYIYNLSSVTIGAITIYDGIDKVDASKITTSVTYMHVENETATDVTSSASTYFTIIEDGDRRIIEKKDDTDYTITIADGIEHGSIAYAATTAKYGEKITITATPDFGYRLSRLIVKDAENNDVASTGNSFFMPKSNVTVSAVFEQGTHGTTEFAWGDFGPTGFVREATIYDGLTTVNLQQGQSYKILKYDNEYSYSKFLLDNNTSNVTIPYSGGTGTFSEFVNATNFKVDYNGEEGFYDITMTDAGNGKWSVSIQKTVGVIDNIPDQTYTGSEITPEPLVLAGSLNLTKGTDYEYSYTNNTNVGTATVTVTFKGDYASLGSVEKAFTINAKALTDANVSDISAQTYTGLAIEPEITCDGITLTLGTDYEVSYSDNTNVGTAKATITGIGNYSGTVEKPFTISPKVTNLGALTLTEDQNGITAEINGNYDQTDAFSLDNGIENVSVTINRTFTSGITSTIVLPFDIEAEGYSGGEFYEFSDIDTKTWTATMSKVTSVTAHTPYLFVPNGNALTISQKVTLKATSGTAATTKNGWIFTGVYQKKVWGADDGNNKDYCFAANATDGISVGEFVKIGTYVQVKPFRCYLTRKDGISKSAEQLPETIHVRLIDETSSVIDPLTPDPLNPNPSDPDITTPVSEITPNSGVKVWSFDGTIYIESQPSTDYSIIDLSGRTLTNGVTTSTRETVTLSRRTAGIVIVKIEQQTFKVNY